MGDKFERLKGGKTETTAGETNWKLSEQRVKKVTSAEKQEKQHRKLQLDAKLAKQLVKRGWKRLC